MTPRKALLLSLVALSSCAPSRPPELAGLWSAGPASCAAGIGLRFEPRAVTAVFAEDREALLARPEYSVDRTPGRLSVRVAYDADHGRAARAHGVLVFERREDGSLAPVSHAVVDGVTGAARIRLRDPLMRAMRLQPCAASGAVAGLRGRGGA